MLFSPFFSETRCFYCESMLYNSNILSWKFRGVGSLGRVSDSQKKKKKKLFMTNRRICFREKFLVSVVIFVNKKKKTLNSVVVRWNIKQCCCALVLLLMISSAHYSDQCLYPKRERVDLAIKIRERTWIYNRNELLVYILLKFNHFKGFVSSCTSVFFAIQLKKESLVRSIQN